MQIKKRIFSGVVCEQEVYFVHSPFRKNPSVKREPRIRFKNEAERERHRTEISRRRHTRLFNENFTTASLYSTLTLDDANEVYSFEEMKKIRDLYIRRLRRAYPDAVIFAYIGKGKTTQRFHMHMVSNGIPEEAIIGKWTFGRIFRVEHLRENCRYKHADGQMYDHGADYSGLANYLFDHWTPEQGGHRYKATRNARKPEEEEPVECKRWYSLEHPPVAPKGYELVDARSTDYGFYLYKYVRKERKAETVLRTPCRCVKFNDERRLL